jgi:predicted DNA-binding mobile mystery protein A
MNNIKDKLQMSQVSSKIKAYKKASEHAVEGSWINATRKSLGMSLAQLGSRMNMTAQGVREMEKREKAGTLSLNNLQLAAQALGLKMTYGFINIDADLEKLLYKQAKRKAQIIVGQVHRNMSLENQANSRSRLRLAVKERTQTILNTKPRYLWD